MKIPGFIFIVLFWHSCSTNIKSGSYTKTYIDDLNGHTIKVRIDTNIMSKDTFFLKRKSENGITINKIFIDPNTNSRYYTTIFGVSSFDNENIKAYANEVAKSGHVLNRINIGDFPAEWRPVVKFHNKYYLYDPSDDGNKSTIMLTDSTLMPYFFGDGYTPIALESVTKKADNLYIIKTNHLVANDKSCPSGVKIYIIDKKTKLSVWEMNIEGGPDYWLMVPKTTMHYFPVIVNESVNKEDEFDFESIDYKKLVSK